MADNVSDNIENLQQCDQEIVETLNIPVSSSALTKKVKEATEGKNAEVASATNVQMDHSLKQLGDGADSSSKMASIGVNRGSNKNKGDAKRNSAVSSRSNRNSRRRQNNLSNKCTMRGSNGSVPGNEKLNGSVQNQGRKIFDGSGQFASRERIRDLNHTSCTESKDKHSKKVVVGQQCQYSSLPGELSDIAKYKLKVYEFYPNWIFNSENLILFPEDEASTILSTISNELNEMCSEGENKSDRDAQEMKLRVHGLLPIMNKNAQAYLYIFLRDYDQASQSLEESNQLVDLSLEKGIFDPEYITGLFYVIKGLQVALEIKKANSASKTNCKIAHLNFNFDVDNFVRLNFEPFLRLSRKARIAVSMSKYFFMKHRRGVDERISEEIGHIVQMDPDNYEWRIYHYIHLQSQRLQRDGEFSCPEENEIKAIQMAWRMVREHPFCLAYMSLCAAELLRFRNVVCIDQEHPLVFGEMNFISAPEVANFIRINALKALEVNTECIQVNLILANIFGIILPFMYRNSSLSRECVFRAFRVGEMTSSRANHRMALYFLTGSQTYGLNPSVSEKYLERAFALDRKNFNALCELIKVYMGKPRENLEKIHYLFETQLKSKEWSKRLLAKLLFLQGCFLFMTFEETKAINSWLFALELWHSSVLNFKLLRTMSYVYRRYHWSYESLNLISILQNVALYSEAMTKNNVGLAEVSFKKKVFIKEILHIVREAVNTDLFWINQFKNVCLQDNEVLAESGSSI